MNKDSVPLKTFEPYLNNAADKVTSEIRDYHDNEYRIMGIIGKRGSPLCGVNKSFVSEGNLSDESGYFIEDLKKRFKKEHWDIPFFEWDTHEPGKSADSLAKLFS